MRETCKNAGGGGAGGGVVYVACPSRGESRVGPVGGRGDVGGGWGWPQE